MTSLPNSKNELPPDKHDHSERRLSERFSFSAVAEIIGEAAHPDSTQVLRLMAQDSPRGERNILGRLIGLMMQKKVLSREEGVALLDDLLRENQK